MAARSTFCAHECNEEVKLYHTVSKGDAVAHGPKLNSSLGTVTEMYQVSRKDKLARKKYMGFSSGRFCCTNRMMVTLPATVRI